MIKRPLRQSYVISSAFLGAIDPPYYFKHSVSQGESMKQDITRGGALRILVTLLLVIGIMGGFTAGRKASASAGDMILKMATTTSTDNTGLLDYLAPFLRRDTGIELLWIAVGSGKALKLGENCDVDVLLVHAPRAEKEFIEKNYGIGRKRIMYNDFVLIGPEDDPAGIKGTSVSTTLAAIASKRASFVSRGDNSGTHEKEITLWKDAGLPVPDRQRWYIQTGQGMLSTIMIAGEREAYTLTDRGTFIRYEWNWDGNPPLAILVEAERCLHNQYSIIIVNPARCRNFKYELAKTLSDWMTSPRAQKLIGAFTLMGKQLFIPNAIGK
jgi:tungstate transport system substrate-binding protein